MAKGFKLHIPKTRGTDGDTVMMCGARTSQNSKLLYLTGHSSPGEGEANPEDSLCAACVKQLKISRLEQPKGPMREKVVRNRDMGNDRGKNYRQEKYYGKDEKFEKR